MRLYQLSKFRYALYVTGLDGVEWFLGVFSTDDRWQNDVPINGVQVTHER